MLGCATNRDSLLLATLQYVTSKWLLVPLWPSFLSIMIEVYWRLRGYACFIWVERRYYVWIRQIHKSRPKRRCIYRIHQVKITIPRSHNGFFLSPIAQWFSWKNNKALWYIHLKKTMVFWSRKKKFKKIWAN